MLIADTSSMSITVYRLSRFFCLMSGRLSYWNMGYFPALLTQYSFEKVNNVVFKHL